MAELKVFPNNRVKPESAFLQEFRKNVMSQSGEDGVIEEIFNIMGFTNQWCVEFGAWDGKKYSNTWNLISNYEWSAVLIEGNGERFKELTKTYEDNNKVFAVNAFVSTEGEESLASIFQETPIPNDFDFLCIDVDGCDYHIWKNLTEYRPRLVAIEFNPSIQNNVHFVQDNDTQFNHGSSLRACIELGKEKGYELVATLPCNAFFVRKEDFGKFNIEDNSIDSMHTLGEMESLYFQLYDGTVVLAGCTWLIWHGVPIDLQDIQVLPKALRKHHG